MGQTKIDLSKKDRELYVKISGPIDEDFVYDEILKSPANKYILDLEDVTVLNSCGIREWIKFLSALGTACQVVYRNCPQMVIYQMGMVKGILCSNATIETFFAPYFDEEADKEVKILLTLDEVKHGKAPSKKGEHGQELEFDALEESYFRFLSQLSGQ
ncbi:MAG: hypothetical protein AABY86_06340 [Bdellovibrionota bacterium]